MPHSAGIPGHRVTADELRRDGHLCQPLLSRLKAGRDQTAFEYLARETSLSTINDCIRSIPDQELTEFLVEQMLQAASLLSSEAYTGVAQIRDELRELAVTVTEKDPKVARVAYDRRVERLGQYFFALGRRLHQLEVFMAGCPLTGSAEQRRGRYGQRTRDLASDVRFLRSELSRWVRHFVPLNRKASLSEDPEFLEGRLDAVVDELGLRLREVHDTLNATLYEQLILFDLGLTRKELFHGDAENMVDLERLIDWLTGALELAKEYDESRRPEQLERVKALLFGFDPADFFSFSGLRESDQTLYVQCLDVLREYDAEGAGQENDPVQMFMLLTGDFIKGLRRHQQSAVQLDPQDPAGEFFR